MVKKPDFGAAPFSKFLVLRDSVNGNMISIYRDHIPEFTYPIKGFWTKGVGKTIFLSMSGLKNCIKKHVFRAAPFSEILV
jgi:hypothetical protein